MKQYRHIPTGLIAVRADRYPAYLISIEDLKKSGYAKNPELEHDIPAYVVEKGKDWEEVKDKPEWTILSIKSKINDRIRYLDLHSSPSIDYNIHSVRRESDGEVFTIGDSITVKYDHKEDADGPTWGNIKEFVIVDNRMCIKIDIKQTHCMPFLHTLTKVKEEGDTEDDCDNCGGTYDLRKPCPNCGHMNGNKFLYDLKYAIKIDKKPLFTTEDGVDIYEGNKFWYLHPAYKHHIFDTMADSWIGYTTNSNYCKKFSTKEAAEEYILMNKPCYSLKDIKKVMGGYVDTDTLNYIIETLMEGH